MYDGVTSQTFDDVGAPAFSPDGRHFAYVAISGDSCFLVKDGVPQASAGTSGSQTVTFSPDGGRVAYVASAIGNQFVVTDGLPGPRFPLVADLTLCFSPDGSRLAYVAGANAPGSRCFVVVDESPGPDCDFVVPAWVNPEGWYAGRTTTSPASPSAPTAATSPTPW